MQDYRKLDVWQLAHQVVLRVYAETAAFSADERFGLTQQMRRSAASIPTNIAEGCGRGGSRELAQFLRVAAGSASELEYQVLLARDLHQIPADQAKLLEEDVARIRRMLAGLLQRVLENGKPAPREMPRNERTQSEPARRMRDRQPRTDHREPLH